jgi:hypothetical protein
VLVINRVTSGRRALIAAWVRQATNLPALYAVAWADACAALVEDGWPTASRPLLARQLDPADVDRAGRTLLGGIPPEPDELTHRRLAHALPELAAPSGGLPRWVTVGVQLGDELIFARPTLDLDAADAADARQWPPVTVAGLPDRRRAAGRPRRGRGLGSADPLRARPCSTPVDGAPRRRRCRRLDPVG